MARVRGHTRWRSQNSVVQQDYYRQRRVGSPLPQGGWLPGALGPQGYAEFSRETAWLTELDTVPRCLEQHYLICHPRTVIDPCASCPLRHRQD